jgi:imidazole glycerol-phosphate synthase subunit HisF
MMLKMRPRVMPCLLISDSLLVKPCKFNNPSYIGDPMNAIKIFNDKEVDELILIDIDATIQQQEPQYELIRSIAQSCFMPLCYGGGINKLEQATVLFNSGVEKITINAGLYTRPGLVSQIAKIYGSQSVVASIDVKKNFWKKDAAYINCGTFAINEDLVSYVKRIENEGAGEILLTSIEREGTWTGYDLDLINKISGIVKIPVIANGGAGSIEDFKNAYHAGASAMAAGSMFVYIKKDMGVLINFPYQKDLDILFK